MNRALNIYKFIFKYPIYLSLGIIFLLLFTAFSGISITLVIPMFDNIFITERAEIITYTTLSEFTSAINNTISNFFNNNFNLSTDNLTILWSNTQKILDVTDPWLLLKIICSLLIILYFLKNLFYFINRLMFVNLRGKTINDIRNTCYKKYLSQSYAFFNQNRVGDSIVRMVNDIENVNNLFIDNIFKFLKEFAAILIYAFIALKLNYQLFFISLLILPPFTISVRILAKKMKKYAKKIQSQLSDMFSNIEEVLNSMRIVKAFCKEDYEHKKLISINRKYFKFWRKSQIYWSFGVPISELSSIFIGIAILFIGGKDILEANSAFSFGDFTAFLFAIFSMLHPLKALTNSITDIKKAMISVDRVSEILELDSEIFEISNPIKIKDFNKTIEFKNVNFCYDEGKQILSNINFIINKGEKVAFVGASGSGKTTIANLINRMYDVTEGEILIDNIPIKSIKIDKLRTLFGIVTQDSILFSDTIENNINYGSHKPINIDDIKKACQFAYASEFIEQLPEQYNTRILPHGSNLSGGQRQRLCIARAIVNNPPILIFDEATSALDTDSEQKVQKAIDMAADNRTVIMIAHRLSTILTSDKIFVLEKGKIVGAGKHNELLQTCQQYEHFFNLQFKGK